MGENDRMASAWVLVAGSVLVGLWWWRLSADERRARLGGLAPEHGSPLYVIPYGIPDGAGGPPPSGPLEPSHGPLPPLQVPGGGSSGGVVNPFAPLFGLS